MTNSTAPIAIQIRMPFRLGLRILIFDINRQPVTAMKMKYRSVMSPGVRNWNSMIAGKISAADAELLVKWLTTDDSVGMIIWRAGDMNNDGKLNTIDLTLLKRMLIQK